MLVHNSSTVQKKTNFNSESLYKTLVAFMNATQCENRVCLEKHIFLRKLICQSHKSKEKCEKKLYEGGEAYSVDWSRGEISELRVLQQDKLDFDEDEASDESVGTDQKDL